MTDQEISNLTDSQINEAVARKLGKVIRENKDFRNPFEVIRREPDDHSISYEEIPPYATDIKAAWEIVEDAGFYVELKRAVGRQWRCSLGNLVEPVLADTAPRAICMAFLKLETVEPLK